jgi:nucleotide-binding universal stress UspA family protein
MPESKENQMTVVVGFLPTPEGRAALSAAADEALLRRARLLVVNASRGGAYIDPDVAGDVEFGEVERRCVEAGTDVEIMKRSGRDPVDELLEVVAVTPATLLVIGLRHRSPVGKLILGSSAQRLLLDAACPVLAVKADTSSKES